MRRPFLCAVLLLFAFSHLKAEQKPNILFILTEDQGAHLSLLGTPGLQTPNMDRLAKSGVYFDNAFVAYPVCSASKAALYTGVHCHRNGILNNTHNYHKPAAQVTAEERGRLLAKTNRVKDRFVTLTETLKSSGYFQGVTHKLHVLPNEKFPYDQFMGGSQAEIASFFQRAANKTSPWFLMVNIPYSHRPYPNSDKTPIRVKPSDVKLPAYLPESAEVRKDWAEYLAGVEKADAITGATLDALEKSGQSDNTIVVFMSDHGPTFQHGKMTLYDLGLRVPLIIRGRGIAEGTRSDALVSELDLLPTLLDLCGIKQEFPYQLDGQSIGDYLKGNVKQVERKLIFAEISNRGPLPNDGMQERSVFDGRWKMIYREKVDRAWRQVNADTREFKVWGNRTYAETIRLKDQFPRQYQILAEQDPQNLHARVPAMELYDLQTDPDEMNNLAKSSEHKEKLAELSLALKQWIRETDDVSMTGI